MKYVTCPACKGSCVDEDLSALTGEKEPCGACTAEGMVEADACSAR